MKLWAPPSDDLVYKVAIGVLPCLCGCIPALPTWYVMAVDVNPTMPQNWKICGLMCSWSGLAGGLMGFLIGSLPTPMLPRPFSSLEIDDVTVVAVDTSHQPTVS